MNNFLGAICLMLAVAATVQSAGSDISNSLWETSTVSDPFQDQQVVVGMIRNSDAEILTVKCDEFGSDAYIAFILDDFVARGERKRARVRIDRGEIWEIDVWAVGDALAIIDQEILALLFNGFRKGREVAVGVFDYQKSRIVSQFSLVGYSNAENAVRTTCRFSERKREKLERIELTSAKQTMLADRFVQSLNSTERKTIRFDALFASSNVHGEELICAYATNTGGANTISNPVSSNSRHVYMVFEDGFVIGGDIDDWAAVNDVCEQAKDGYRFRISKSNLLQ